MRRYDVRLGARCTASASTRPAATTSAPRSRSAASPPTPPGSTAVGNPSPDFASGIDTNYGGSWHRISSPVLPNRFIAGLTVDPANPAHVYAIFNGYSRRWIPGGGLGTVFESTDGGSTWHNISGNLPDAPGDGLAIVNGTLVLGTDIGLFIASDQLTAPTGHASTGCRTSSSTMFGVLPVRTRRLLERMAAVFGASTWDSGRPAYDEQRRAQLPAMR